MSGINQFVYGMEQAALSGDVTSGAVGVDDTSLVAIQVVWTGSAVGKLKLQCSVTGTFWSDVLGSDVVVSGPGDVLYNLAEIGYSMIRVIYLRTSGSGYMTASINGKLSFQR